MLKRIISALIALPIFFIAVFWAPTAVFTILMCAVCATACYEMLHTTGLCASGPLFYVSIILSAGILPLTVFAGFESALSILLCGIVIFITAIFSRSQITCQQIFAAFFSTTFIPLALGAVLRIRMMDFGIIFVLLPFMAAWLTDTFAYFTGMLIGRHHIAPHISPKKTLEGCIGGTLFCTLTSLLLIPIAKPLWGVIISWKMLIPVMLIASILSQFGDLSMSYIKRAVGIKDYGNIMPGHGGILDRFDSVLLSAPVVEICLSLMKVI